MKRLLFFSALTAALLALAAACGGGQIDLTTPSPSATETPTAATTARATPAVTPSPWPVSTPAAAPTLPPTPATIPTGNPLSFDDFRMAWEARSMTVTLGAFNAAFKGFATPAFDARLARGSDSLDLSVLVYEERQAIREDWELTVGESPVPKEGRVLPDHISSWWNDNVTVVVRAAAGDMASDALDAFLALGEPITASEPKVVFVPQPTSLFPTHGVLWMANPDGSEQERLTPDDVRATFAGLISDRKSGNLMFYYLTLDGETTRTLWRLNVNSGDRSSLFSFEVRSSSGASAAVSPDGQHAAYVHANGIDLIDLLTGESRSILTAGNIDACLGGDISECVGYGTPQWSPNGRLLLVTKGFYEGGTAIVVDPFEGPPAELVESSLGDALPSAGEWSSSSKAFCAYGQYATYSGLWVGRPPDWKPINLLPGYEIQDATDPEYVGRTVTGCAWIDGKRVAISSTSTGDPVDAQITVLDTETSELSVIATFDENENLFSRSLIGSPGGELLVTQFIRPSGNASQPVVIDTTSGEHRPILSEGDWVVAVLAP